MVAGLRKLSIVLEEICSVGSHQLQKPAKRAIAAAVLRNPLAGSSAVDDDLGALVDLGYDVGGILGERAADALGAPVVSYGKGVIIGTNGQLEHGAAVVHPRFGASVRAAVGIGVDIMPSTKKVAAAGAGIDIPMHNKVRTVASTIRADLSPPFALHLIA
eukprot:SAG31_NODE_1123_length_9787_cov_5.258877_12_plen_160_part_00